MFWVALRRAQENQVMKFFPVSPMLLLLISGVGLSILQIGCAECSFGGFSVLGQHVSPELYLLYLFFGVAACVGYFLATPLIRDLEPARSRVPLQDALEKHLIQVIFFNAAIILISQYYMRDANFIQIMAGNVSAQEIEEVLRGSPIGVHGVKLLAGFYAVLLHRACKLGEVTGWKIVVLHLQAVFIFLSSAKIGGMLFWVASLLSLSGSSWKSLIRVVIGALLIVLLFVGTRILRNPGMEMAAIWEFLFAFMFGLYMGSPVVNTNFILLNPEFSGSFVFLLSHFIPQKLLPVTLLDLMKSFPDPTSPLGVVGAAFGFLSYFGVAMVGVFCGFLARKLQPQGLGDIARIIFLPFLIVSCAFAVMYHHFFNLTFFWIPLGMSFFLSRKYFRYE